MNHQLALTIPLREEATLANFCWEENAWLQTQLQITLNSRDERFLYLWGGRGHGKTHLLQACCQTIVAPDSAIYLPLKDLQEWGPEILEGIEKQSLVSIDDIHIIATNPRWEEALFHLYNRIRDDGKTILVIAGTMPPAQLPLYLADLRSRLSWGLVIQIQELGDTNKVNTLKRHARQRGFELPTHVGQFLLNHCTRNMHDLNDMLHRLDTASLIAQRKITIPFVKHVLGI